MTQTHIQRCEWIQGKPDYYVAYHDNIWGVAEHDDQKLFQWLILESFHVGLSWQLVLSKKEAFMKAFDQFDYNKVAQYDERKIEALTQNADIIRHRGKIKAAIMNAQAFIKVREEFTSFDDYIWGFVNREPVVKKTDEHVTQSALSDAVTKDMKRRGFKFIGSITIYSYLQAIGIINDHDLHCDFR
ncbi:DNA-3-methyladenine glycosylase I [Aerococcaceae bacterium WGS1372]